MCPYIKREERSQYDELIVHILQSDDGFSSTHADELIALLKPLDITAVDGHFNYFLTKTLKLLNGLRATIYLEPFRGFILKVLRGVYQPKYFNYNRAIGMLFCVALEYERRNGKRNSFLVKTFLGSVAYTFYQETVAIYENQKIAENSDIE